MMPTVTTQPPAEAGPRLWPLVVGGDRPVPLHADRMRVVDPANGLEVGSVPVAGPVEVDAAVTAARTAFPAWWHSGTPARAAAVRRFAGMIEANAERLAVLDTRCTGMPISGMRAEMREAVARTLRIAHDAFLSLGDSAPATP